MVFYKEWKRSVWNQTCNCTCNGDPITCPPGQEISFRVQINTDYSVLLAIKQHEIWTLVPTLIKEALSVGANVQRCSTSWL